ncbi:MAG: hypothetical protein F6J86_34730 [Symploca sp. SIO1B1]|nr:hypothetical protein [Symploca sp. SIO1B1]
MTNQSLFASLLSLNNIGQLYADDGTFLGLLSTDSWNDLSIINPRTYANPYTLDSIQNKNGFYGSTYGLFSPYNPHCLTPPWILVDGQPVIAVTVNQYYLSNGKPIITPDVLISTYQLASQQQGFGHFQNTNWNYLDNLF